MITLQNVSKSYGTRTLFRDVTFTIASNDRIALLGPNGAGKSTLLEVIAGDAERDCGEIVKAKDTTIGYLKQELSLQSNKLLLNEVCSSVDYIQQLKHRIEYVSHELESELDLANRDVLLRELGELQHKFEAAGAYDMEFEAKKILSGLGFKESDYSKCVSEFSGGWIMRVELAKILLLNPDMLLLDEPTNHLDLETQIWFEKYLKNYDGAVLLTSHDRAFLNKVIKRVAVIEDTKMRFYTGNYDAYMIAKETERMTLEATAKKQAEQIERDTRFIERFRYKATKAKQVQSREKMLAKIDRVEVPRNTERIHFKFPDPPKSSLDIIRLTDVSKSYGINTVYKHLDLIIRRGSKVALVGPNGAGKSTLLKVLAGVLSIDDGTRELGQNVSLAYYAQHQLENLEPNNTIVTELQKCGGIAIDNTTARTILGGFLFHGDDVLKKINVLSGGEKARLALAKMLVMPVNFLLLDEPTNHLDINSREILTDALQSYKGTLCFVTHDRTLISEIADTIIDIRNGKVTVFEENYESYLEHSESLRNEECEVTLSQPKSIQINTKQKRAVIGQLRNEFYKKSTPIQDKIKKIENEMDRYESEIKELEKFFENAIDADAKDLFDKSKRHSELKKLTSELSDEWTELSLEYEAMKEDFDKQVALLENDI